MNDWESNPKRENSMTPGRMREGAVRGEVP